MKSQRATFAAGFLSCISLCTLTGRLGGADELPAASGPAAASPPIQIGDVIGLPNELAIRPKEGLSYTVSRVLFVNLSGLLESVAGNPSDCVHVDGTATRCTDPSNAGIYVDGEIPSGTKNGTNATFQVKNAPNPPTALHLFRNGIRLSSSDFSVTGSTIVFVSVPPKPQDSLVVDYRY